MITVNIFFGKIHVVTYFSPPPLSPQTHYSLGWASASFKIFLHPSWFRVTTVQFLYPSLAASSFTPSSQHIPSPVSSIPCPA